MQEMRNAHLILEGGGSSSMSLLPITYLTAQKQTFAHIGYTNHETRSSFVIGYNSMLTELHCLTTFLRPGHLHTEQYRYYTALYNIDEQCRRFTNMPKCYTLRYCPYKMDRCIETLHNYTTHIRPPTNIAV